VHIVLLAWLYVMLTMALTLDSLWAGLAWFALLGIAPVLVAAWLAARRLRMERERQRTSEPRREP
jgi:hypothetical protein